VKIPRGPHHREKYFCGFAGIPAKNAVGTGSAKEFSEIRLTARAIQVELANCPRIKK
jgi:hypothetical protein